MEFAAPDPWKAIKRDTESKTRRPITVAIAISARLDQRF